MTLHLGRLGWLRWDRGPLLVLRLWAGPGQSLAVAVCLWPGREIVGRRVVASRMSGTVSVMFGR